MSEFTAELQIQMFWIIIFVINIKMVIQVCYVIYVEQMEKVDNWNCSGISVNATLIQPIVK